MNISDRPYYPFDSYMTTPSHSKEEINEPLSSIGVYPHQENSKKRPLTDQTAEQPQAKKPTLSFSQYLHTCGVHEKWDDLNTELDVILQAQSAQKIFSKSRYNQLNVVFSRFLNTDFNISASNPVIKGKTLPILAAEAGRWDLVEKMVRITPHLDWNAAPENGNSAGKTLLYSACEANKWGLILFALSPNNSRQICQRLRDANEALNKEHLGIYGTPAKQTALMIADELAKEIMGMQTLPVSPSLMDVNRSITPEKDGITPFWMAVHNKSWIVAMLMLKLGANPNVNPINDQGQRLGTPFWWAVKFGLTPIIDLICSQHKPDVNALPPHDYNQELTPFRLALASTLGYPPVVAIDHFYTHHNIFTSDYMVRMLPHKPKLSEACLNLLFRLGRISAIYHPKIRQWISQFYDSHPGANLPEQTRSILEFRKSLHAPALSVQTISFPAIDSIHVNTDRDIFELNYILKGKSFTNLSAINKNGFRLLHMEISRTIRNVTDILFSENHGGYFLNSIPSENKIDITYFTLISKHKNLTSFSSDLIKSALVDRINDELKSGEVTPNLQVMIHKVSTIVVGHLRQQRALDPNKYSANLDKLHEKVYQSLKSIHKLNKWFTSLHSPLRHHKIRLEVYEALKSINLKSKATELRNKLTPVMKD